MAKQSQQEALTTRGPLGPEPWGVSYLLIPSGWVYASFKAIPWYAYLCSLAIGSSAISWFGCLDSKRLPLAALVKKIKSHHPLIAS